MAGPEPYPQEKWTPEQEAAYAEGRKSAKGSEAKARPSQSGQKTSSGRKRYVRTAEGEKRYKVPIGSEIGTARNAKGAEAQKDSESTGRYNELVGADQAAQAKAMAGLSDDQVQRLSQVAYSFPSSDPNVVRLRIGVANELRKRGMNVNDFGGLGRGSAKPAGPAPRNDRQSALAKMYGKPRPVGLSDVDTLRTALDAFGRVKPEARGSVASFLVRRAIELGVPHFLGRAVIECAKNAGSEQAIELAGSWKHGWIPLDAAAVSSKMKGKTGGKQWWGAPKGGSKKPKVIARRDAYAFKKRPAKVDGDRTTVVNSGSPDRGATMNASTDHERTRKVKLSHQYDSLLNKPNKTEADQAQLDVLYRQMTGRERGKTAGSMSPAFDKFIEEKGLQAARDKLTKLEAKPRKSNNDKIAILGLRAAIAHKEAVSPGKA